MIKEKINKKLKEKRWYKLFLTDEGEFMTTLRIPTFDRISINNKKRILIQDDTGDYIGYALYLSKEDELIFRETYKNYIIEFEPLYKECPVNKQRVYK